MNARRIIGSVLATTLAATSLGVAAAVAPAQAATTVETRIVPGNVERGVISSFSTPLEYGDSLTVDADVEGFVNGVWTKISNGSITVTEQLASGAPASTVASGMYASAYASVPTRGNAIYTVTFAGGTSGSGSTAINYAPSSGAFQVSTVQRKLTTSTISGKRAGFKGKLSPAKKVKITVFKKQGKKFKKFKKLRSNGKGRFTVVLPAPRRGKFHWKIVFAGDSQFAPSAIKGTTYKGF